MLLFYTQPVNTTNFFMERRWGSTVYQILAAIRQTVENGLDASLKFQERQSNDVIKQQLKWRFNFILYWHRILYNISHFTKLMSVSKKCTSLANVYLKNVPILKLIWQLRNIVICNSSKRPFLKIFNISVSSFKISVICLVLNSWKNLKGKKNYR